MKNRVWRKKGEGLKFTVKGSKNLADGHWLHLIVAMAYGKYVVLKEAYKKLKGPIITKYIRDILHCVCRIWAKKKIKYRGPNKKNKQKRLNFCPDFSMWAFFFLKTPV